MNTAKVFIILATFNRAHLVIETLQSIRNQTCRDWQCIIVDDFSTDDTEKVIQEFIAVDPRFSFHLKTENYSKGLSGSRNYGLDLAQKQGAKFIHFFDDDDIMHPRKLELQIEPFLEDHNLDLTLCKYEGFRKEEEIPHLEYKSDIPIKTENIAEDFLFSKVRINSAGPLFKAHLFKEERFDESLHYGEEREAFLRIFFKYRPKHVSVSEYLFYYRHHPISITARKDNQVEKIGVNIIINQKLWDFLYEHELLNQKITAYFLRQFLLQNNNKFYIKKIESFLLEKKLSSFQRAKFKLIIFINAVYTKIMHKLMIS